MKAKEFAKTLMQIVDQLGDADIDVYCHDTQTFSEPCFFVTSPDQKTAQRYRVMAIGDLEHLAKGMNGRWVDSDPTMKFEKGVDFSKLDAQ